MPKALRRSGFTLTELLIVVGIIVVLAAVVLTGLSRTREQAKNVLCQSNEKRLWEVFVAYAADNDKAFPCPTQTSETTPAAGKSVAFIMKQPRVIQDDPRFRKGTLWRYINDQLDVMNCPSDTERGDPQGNYRNFSYAFNANIRPSLSTPLVTYETIRLSDLKQPGQKVLIYEPDDPDDLCFFGPTSSEKISGRHGGSSASSPLSPRYRDKGKSHQLFLDGHIETVSVSDFYGGAGDAAYKLFP